HRLRGDRLRPRLPRRVFARDHDFSHPSFQADAVMKTSVATATRPPKTNPGSADTRQRLIDAAARLFADQGFENVTVREICKASQANVAAVNYHFGDKAG